MKWQKRVLFSSVNIRAEPKTALRSIQAVRCKPS